MKRKIFELKVYIDGDQAINDMKLKTKTPQESEILMKLLQKVFEYVDNETKMKQDEIADDVLEELK